MVREPLTLEQGQALCIEAKRLASQSVVHTAMGCVCMVANCMAIVFLRIMWPSWIFVPMACAFMVWSDVELRRSKRIIDRLNEEVLREWR